ncbi:acyltransferase family protein [Brachybacterium hainanense]|uniref:Acyltransferase family protein n=1 Tax=Brachybacterium hainanense TaxID=1541174 RepID=A0ABV6RCS8_9MICO
MRSASSTPPPTPPDPVLDLAAPAGSASTSPRLHHLDALRGGALLLGLVLHIALGFVPGQSWLFVDADPTALALPTVFVIHLFRMALFMMLAGYFGRMVLHRRGAGAYMKDRLVRIGLPLIAFWPLAVLSLPVVIVVGSALRGTEIPTDPRAAQEPGLLDMLTPGQLWFLLLLLEIALLVVAARGLLVHLLGTDRAGAISRRLGGALASPAGIVLAAVPYALGMLAQGTGTGGIQEPLTIVPVAGASIAYTGAFLTGWFLHAEPGSMARIARAWPAKLALAVLGTVLAYLAPVQAPALAAVLVPLAAWAWIHGLIGLSARFLDREIPAVRYLADASYWIYLLHLPVVVAIGMALGDVPWPGPLKIAVNFAVTTAALVLLYDLIVRSTWIGRWLNGHRRPRAIFRSRRR